ncbi:hypothetical protein JMF94_07805 [Desulfovibrio sp. UIB00]|uniref:hypothetical protein n=1 Tax=Desulfovibrio sp. UIB00 TaxID=2804314 RepID=UPI001F0D1F48|nr:hypothetical protein [Desulfovibrio sp. UIB00]MCH5144987.1 hypothetical protein [Desulfovibrio sp. UIB00]
MPTIKDVLTLANIRKDLRFFLHRLAIGVIILGFAPDEVLRPMHDPWGFLSKNLYLVFFLLALIIIMTIFSLCKPQIAHFKKVQYEFVELSKTTFSIFRGVMIVCIPAYLVWTIKDNSCLYLFSMIAFIFFIEFYTSLSFGLKDYNDSF